MARGINKVILVGNLGGDPEVRYANNGAAIANISIATTDSWKDKNTGEQQERTEWHRVVMFNRLGEIAGEYLRKGSKVYIEGKLQTRKWQDNNGQDRLTTEIVANEMQMLDTRNNEQGDNFYGQQNQGQSNGHQMNQGNQPQPQQQARQQQQQQRPRPSEDFDDDIPFR